MDDKQRYLLKINEAPDRAALREIIDELAGHSDPNVRAIRFIAGQRSAALRPRAGENFAAAYGISAPTGAPLYRYRIDDTAFERLGTDLARCGGYPALERGTMPALFVLWAAEWFRRHYRGGGHCWANLVAALGIAEDQARLRPLTATGLARWRRDLRRSGAGREYLATLAREGGFPVAAVEGGRGWAGDVLAAIVAPLLADPHAGQDTAEVIALAQRDRLPALYADEEFTLLCADLALAVAEIRREAEPRARASGLPLPAWLALHRPDWRDTLPLAITGSGANALLGALLEVEAAAVTGRGARVERLLARSGRDWREVARISFDGPVDGVVMRGIAAEEGRLRVFASGELARALPGELGMVEPPVDGERGWTARGTRRVRGLLEVPFATAVELDLRSGERRVAQIALPGGKSQRGRLLVMTIEATADTGPTLLRVEGSGSGAYVADTVVVRVPEGWRIEAGDGETVEPAGGEDPRLWQVTGGAVVTDREGDCYRIRTGQVRDRRDRLVIDSHTVGWAGVSGDVDLFAGPPQIRTSDPARGALFVRAIGSGRVGWRRAPAPLPVGHYEIGWRDGPLLLDRRRVAVIPAGATLACAGRGRGARWTPAGWDAVRIVPADNAPVRVTADGWSARPVDRATCWFTAAIHWPGDAPALEVRIAFPSEAAIARWDGTVLRPDAQITLAELRDLVAVDQGAMRMWGELVEPGWRGQTTMTWSFENELPLSSTAADIASLLLPSPFIDASVRLGMLDGIETYWHVRQFALRLHREGGGLVASAGVVSPDAVICGRSFAAPQEEVCFGAWSLVVEANHRPFTLPPDARGGWLIYLRDGDTILSRPEILNGPVGEPGATPLARAMALVPWDGLAEALDTVLAEGAPETIDALVELVCSLRGLPPATFEVLKRLPSHPAVLARMAFAARAEQRDAVMALSDGLPFAWCLLPRAAWDSAVDHVFGGLMAQMAAVPGGAGYAMQAVAATICAICVREPLLEAVLKDGFTAAPRAQAVQLFLQRAAHRLDDRVEGSRYRKRGLPVPADHLERPAHMIEYLDTPFAAALAVKGRWVPDADEVRHVKAVARNFPIFFADAFAASLQELS